MQRGAGVWRLGRLAINPEDYDTLIMMGGGEIFRFEIQYMYRHSCRVTERHPISIKAAALRLDRDCCYRSPPLLNYRYLEHSKIFPHCTVVHGTKLALRGVTPHLVTDIYTSHLVTDI
jgi:hypothetical protein